MPEQTPWQGGGGAGDGDSVSAARYGYDLQRAIAAAVARGRRSVWLPTHNYVIAGEITAPAGFRLVCDPGARLIAPPIAAGQARALFRLNDAAGVFAIEGGELVAPPGLPADATAIAVHTWGRAQLLALDRVTVTGFSWALKVDADAGGDVDVQLRDVVITGRAGVGPSDGVGHFAPAGSLRVDGGRIADVGELATGLHHALYLRDHVALEVDGCAFAGGAGDGYGVHAFGSAAAAAARHRITGCSFDYTAASADGRTMEAVKVSQVTPADVLDCDIACRAEAITLAGRARIAGNRFSGEGGNGYRIYNGAATGAAPGGVIERNEFADTQFIDVNLNAGVPVDVVICDNAFTGAPGSGHIDLAAVAGSRLDVVGNRFVGDGARVLDVDTVADVLVADNVIRNAGASLSFDADMSSLAIVDNDLSNAGAGVAYGVAQTAKFAQGNYGSNAVGV